MSASPIPAGQTNEESLANRVKVVAAALKQAKERGQPFVFEWRQSADTQRSSAEDDAGCGCGPVD